MATVRKRGKGIYQAIYYGHDGRRRFATTHCTSKKAAEIVAARLEREAQDPDYAAKNAASLSGALDDALMGRLARPSAAFADRHRRVRRRRDAWASDRTP